jgi:hypothetical protein
MQHGRLHEQTPVSFPFPGAVYGMHITHYNNGTYRLGGIDVTQYHDSVPMTDAGRGQLASGFAAERRRRSKQTKVLKTPVPPAGPETPLPPVNEPPVSMAATPRRRYLIPLALGEAANLDLPPSITRPDLERLKGWLELMADILTDTRG